jgi:hypothetical protein
MSMAEMTPPSSAKALALQSAAPPRQQRVVPGPRL